jgi:hypothetical protein
MIAPARLRGRDRYERTMEGWTDNTHADALTHTVRLRDPDRAVELAAVCTTSPDYAIREARGRVLGGAVDPAVAEAMARLAGLRMVAGFTRRAAEVAGGGAGAAFMVDAAVEVARLARQVTKVPRERAERAAGDPRLCWELDTTAWVDLPDSCFTYSAAGRALFGTRAVTTPMHPDLYSPRPGQTRVFVRRKVARLERHDGRLRLFHAMHDDVHGFELHLEVDPVSGRIVQAEHQTPRLPYMGICSEPQRNLAALVGETVDEGLRKRIGPLIGGPGGCAQLYDLTADLLRLVLT